MSKIKTLKTTEKDELPKISIVTTVWNLCKNGRIDFFHQMMESVHNQTYPNIEHIVIDNNSDDDTKYLIKEYVKKGWIAKNAFEKKQGLWHGMNKGIEEAKGDFINFMNSDDYFCRNDAVELSVNALLKTGANWSYGWSNKVKPDNVEEIIFEWHFDDYASIYNARCPNHQTLFVKTDLLRMQGGFAIIPELGGTFSDDLSMMRLLFAGHIPTMVPEVLVIFRDDGASSNIGRANASTYVQYMRNEFGFYELSEKELDVLYWENNIKKLDNTSFETILNKITIPAWRKRLVYLYGKDFPAVSVKLVKNIADIPQISIIVPLYNAECFIRRGIYSLLNQTLENIEILCINDGSNDTSLKILQELEILDSRIRIFNQKNSGPATSRNVGLRNACGKYIMFMDADDSYHPDMCKTMLQAIEEQNTDVVMCNTNMLGKDYGNYPFCFGPGKFDIDFDIRKKVNVWLWNKIFKTDIIRKNKICFPDGHKSDDDVFIGKYFIVAKNIYCIDQKLVNHFATENSIMDIYNSVNPNKMDIFDHICALENIIDFAKKHLPDSDDLEDYMQHLFKTQIYYAWRNVGTQIEDEFIDQLRKCINSIGKQYVPEFALFDALMQGDYKTSAYLLDCFAEQFKVSPRRKYVFQKDLKPAFNENYVPIVLSCDNNYCKYLSVTLQSIIEHSSSKRNYDVIILEENISDENKIILQSQMPYNFSIRFYNMKAFIEKYKLKTWWFSGRLNIAAYFRLFIAEILIHYKKCIYLDVDTIVQSDIYDLYQIDIKDNFLGAVRDILQTRDETQKYFINHLKMKDPKNNYFNTGVLLMNLEKFNMSNLMEKILFFAKINNKFYHDQNILNAACEGNVMYLSPKWNMITSTIFYKEYKETPYNAPFNNFCDNLNASLNSKINVIHYAVYTKPWHNAFIPMANIWWKYAKNTPYYEQILINIFPKSIHEQKNNNPTTKPFYTMNIKIHLLGFSQKFYPSYGNSYKGNKTKWKLWGITILQRRHIYNWTQITYKLFNIIPLINIKDKEKKRIYYLLGLPLITKEDRKFGKSIWYLFRIIPLIKKQ